MESLTAICGDVLLGLDFSTDTCLQLLVLASSCELNLLIKYLVPFIAENFQSVKLQNYLLDLPDHLLCRILSENCLDVADEREVLDVVLKWLHRGKERFRSATKLLQTVRLATMELSTQEWQQLKKNEAVRSNEEARRIVQQAIIYSMSPAHRWALSGPMTIPRPSTGEKLILATVDFYGACIWMEDEESWLQTKFKMKTESSVLSWIKSQSMYECWRKYPENEVVCYGRRLFMALWDIGELIYCEDLLTGTWKKLGLLPRDVRKGPLIVAPGFLYVFGKVTRKHFKNPRPGFNEISPLPVYRLDVSSCCSTSDWKPETGWEPALPVPRALNVSFGFHLDNMIFLFEKEVIYDSKICPKCMKGVHVFYIGLQEWKHLDDPRENWENNEALKRIRFKSHHPVYADGKVYLTTSEDKICVLDLATMQLDLKPNVAYSTYSGLMNGFMASYNDKVVWIEDEKLCGLCPITGKQTQWPKMPMLEYPQCLVVSVKHSQLESSWNAFFCDYNGKTVRDFWIPKDYRYHDNCRWNGW